MIHRLDYLFGILRQSVVVIIVIKLSLSCHLLAT